MSLLSVLDLLLKHRMMFLGGLMSFFSLLLLFFSLFMGLFDSLAMLLNSDLHRLYRSFVGSMSLRLDDVLLVGNRFLSGDMLGMLNREFDVGLHFSDMLGELLVGSMNLRHVLLVGSFLGGLDVLGMGSFLGGLVRLLLVSSNLCSMSLVFSMFLSCGCFLSLLGLLMGCMFGLLGLLLRIFICLNLLCNLLCVLDLLGHLLCVLDNLGDLLSVVSGGLFGGVVGGGLLLDDDGLGLLDNGGLGFLVLGVLLGEGFLGFLGMLLGSCFLGLVLHGSFMGLDGSLVGFVDLSCYGLGLGVKLLNGSHVFGFSCCTHLCIMNFLHVGF